MCPIHRCILYPLTLLAVAGLVGESASGATRAEWAGGGGSPPPSLARPPEPAGPPAGDARESSEVRTWRSRARTIDLLLHAGGWEEARRRSERLLAEMCDQIVGGPGTEAFLGVVLTYLALAEEGSGLSRQAEWHWDVAKQLFPDAATLDLSSFGEPGARLGSDRLAPGLDLEEIRRSMEGRSRGAAATEGVVRPPRRKRAPEPKFPEAQKPHATDRVVVVLQVIIGKDGLPRQPRILESEGERTFVLSALEAMKDWTFEPATLDGEPVAVYYNLTVNFRMK